MATVSSLVDIDDAEVQRRILSGDAAAWKFLVDRYEGPLLLFLRARFRKLDTEDVAQETWIKILSCLQDWNPAEGRFSSWMMRIAQNLAIDQLRKRRRRQTSAQPIDNLPEPAAESLRESLLETERLIALRKCFVSADGDDVQTLQLKLQGLSGQEISELLDIAGGTVSSRISRAKAQLADCLRRTLK